MKRFFGAIALCSAVLAVCSFVVVREADAVQVRGDVVSELLSLPAPPPPNPLERAPRVRSGNDAFYSPENPPPDNAPIEDILDYWARQTYRPIDYNVKPSPVVLDRIAAAMESDPSRISSYMNYLKDSQRGIAAVRSAYNRAVAEARAANEGDGGYAAANKAANLAIYDGDYGYDGGYGGTADSLKRWLIMNDPTFSAELEPLAAAAKDTASGYIENYNEFLALAHNDWGRARPMIDRMYADPSQPASQTLARWALYRKAMEDGSLSDAERYRAELTATIKNRDLAPGVRDLAFDALVHDKEWSGRDEWYFSLMEDESLLLLQGYTGLTTLIRYSPPGKYTEKMAQLVKSSNPTVRAAAARNLVIDAGQGNKDAIEALLPWLEDPKWAQDIDNSRSRLVQALTEVEMPASVPGLIAIMDERVEVRRGLEKGSAANTAVNVVDNVANADAVSNTNIGVYRGPVETEVVYMYPFRSVAVNALAKQASPIAVPALRRLYAEVTSNDPDEYLAGGIVEALFKCGGFSIPQQVDAVESYMRNSSEIMKMATSGEWDMDSVYALMMEREKRTPEERLNERLGTLTIAQKEPPDELVAATIRRIKTLDAREPAIADMLRLAVTNWNTRAANAMLLADLKDGKAVTQTAVTLLARRKQLRETQANDVFNARGGVPTAAGIATCILEDTPSYSAIMNDTNTAVKSAFLACARLVRIPLSPDDVARELSSPDKKLALAAKLYLLSEDSARSRQILYASFPNEALIAGSYGYFTGAPGGRPQAGLDITGLFESVDPRFSSDRFDIGRGTERVVQSDEKFQKEVLANGDILGIYAFDNNIVRIFADRVVYDKQEDETRSYRQVLSAQDFDRLKRILADGDVGEMKASVVCIGACAVRELLMIGRAGGSRVFSYANKTPELFKKLDEYFGEIGKREGMLHYAAMDKVPGLQIIFADPRLSVETVWADGGDVRFFARDVAARAAADEEYRKKVQEFYAGDMGGIRPDYSYIEKLREEMEYTGRTWYSFSAERIDAATAPAGFDLPPSRKDDRLDTISATAIAADGSMLQSNGDALFKVTGTKEVKLADGDFVYAVISSDGRWVLARRDNGTSAEETGFVRIDTATMRSYPLERPEYHWLFPVAWIPGVNKFLAASPDIGGGFARSQKFIDPVSGELSPVTGEVRPFMEQSFRLLQPASDGGFWAAVTDEETNETSVGVITMPSLKFQKRATIPDTTFNSMQMWVDEKESTLYFVYSGHLLRMPVGNEPSVPPA